MASTANIKFKGTSLYGKTSGIYFGKSPVKAVYSGQKLVWTPGEEPSGRTLLLSDDKFPMVEYTPTTDITLHSYAVLSNQPGPMQGSVYSIQRYDGVQYFRANSASTSGSIEKVTKYGTDCFKLSITLETPITLKAGVSYFFFGIEGANDPYATGLYYFENEPGVYKIINHPLNDIDEIPLDTFDPSLNFIGNSDELLFTSLKQNDVFKYTGASVMFAIPNTYITQNYYYQYTANYIPVGSYTDEPADPIENGLYIQIPKTYSDRIWGSTDYTWSRTFLRYVNGEWNHSWNNINDLFTLSENMSSLSKIDTYQNYSDKKYYLEINGVEI